MQETDLLNCVYQNAEMNRDAIMTLIRRTDDPAFRKSLETQLTEYQNIFNEAEQQLMQRQRQPSSASAGNKWMVHRMTDMKTMTNNEPSHLAELMIQGSTMGITKMQKRLNDYSGTDKQVTALAVKELQTEQANIEEMKKFL